MSYPPPGGYGYPPQANYIPPQPVYCPGVPQNDTFVGYPPQPVFGNPSGPYNTSPAAMPYTQTGMPMAGGPQYDQPFSFAGTAYAASAALNFRQNYPPQAQTYLPQAQPYPQPTDYSAPQSPYPQQYSAPQSTYPQQYNYLEQSNNAQPLYPQQPTLTQQQPNYQQQQQPYTQQTNSVQQPQQTHFQTVPQTQASSAEIPKEPATQGTVKEFPCFKPQQDAEDLRKAMKGFGTDEKAVIQIIGTRSNTQRQKIKLEFATMFGKDLIKELISELSGNFQKTVLALLAPPDEFDASELYTSMKGVGTDEKALIEILCTRTNAQIRAASNAFKRLYKEDLEKWILSETSGHFRRLLVSLVQGSRNENDPLNHQKAVEDAQALYKAGEARWGTDESRFNVILASRSFPQLRLVFDEYQKISKKTLEIAIQKEMSGDLKDGMLAIVKCAQDKPKYFAERLYHSMKGLGTDDKTLIRIMVSRSEIDMVQIKAAFKSMYGKTLASFISDDCSGDYKKLLIQICGQ